MDRTYSTLVAGTGTQSGVDNPEYNAILAAARVEMDPAKREAMYADLASKLHDDPFGIYLLTMNELDGGSPNLNWTVRQDARMMLSEMSFN